MNRPSAEHPVPCATQPRLFESTAAADHYAARLICAECPFTDWCKGEAIKARAAVPADVVVTIQGTWHGVLYASDAKKRRAAKAGRL